MSHRPADDPLLDAARDCVLAVGVRRTTLTDVARRAGVSRMTVYRRFPDVTALLQALMTREFARLLADAEAEAEATGAATERERLALLLPEGAERLCGHPLFQRILDVDPELLHPYVFQRLGAFQRLVLDGLAHRIARGQEDGSIRPGDPRALAAALEMLVRGYVVSARAEDPDGRRAAVGALLPALVDGLLHPAGAPVAR
jgi:AcrR family transcriptional regulator